MQTFLTPPCTVCGKQEEISLDPEKVSLWQSGVHIQKVWPEKTADEREMIMTGTHPKCWDEMFKEEDEDGSEQQQTYE